MSLGFSATIQEVQVLFDGEERIDELATFQLGNHPVLRCIINNSDKCDCTKTITIGEFAYWMEACAPRRPQSTWFAASLFARELEETSADNKLQVIVTWG